MRLEEQRALVRELARRHMAIATSDEMKIKDRRWRDTMSRRTPDRVSVWLNLRACRREVQPVEGLRCDDPFLRAVEDELRWRQACHSFGDDAVVLPYWPVEAGVRNEVPHGWGVRIKHERPPTPGGAWKYDPPLRDEADFAKLQAPRFYHDEAETARRRERYEDLLGDIIPVRIACSSRATSNLGNVAAYLIGLDALMLNLAMNPAMIHRLMAFLRDASLATLDQIEPMGLLTENNDAPKHFSDSLKTSPDCEPVKVSDLWHWTNSQEFELVGPDMWREFCLDYQRPIVERFGAVSYGCCENLTLKIDDILSLGNLRVFVSSPWTDLEAAAAKCAERGVCIEWRQKATDVTFASDLERCRAHLERGLRVTQGLNRFIVLQEVQTLNNASQRFKDWVTMAIELSERLSVG